METAKKRPIVSTMPAPTLRKATVRDVPQIEALVRHFADKDLMLHRTLGELYENLRDFYVVAAGSEVIACGALHLLWEDLAEIKSVAVREEYQGKGFGRAIVEVCLEEARELGLASVFALTLEPAFFEKLGFAQLNRMELPRKVWGECIRCPKFHRCDEIAVIYRF